MVYSVKQKNVLMIMPLSLCGMSCQLGKDPLKQPSATLIEMEGEDGETEVFLTGEDWDISGVINNSENAHISGDSYLMPIISSAE